MVGIYLLKQDDIIVYVGQSRRIEARLREHEKSANKEYNKLEIIKCEEDELNDIEYDLIRKHTPIYNIQHNPFVSNIGDGQMVLTDVEIIKIYGIPKSTLQDWKKDKESWRYKVYLKLKGCQNDR